MHIHTHTHTVLSQHTSCMMCCGYVLYTRTTLGWGMYVSGPFSCHSSPALWVWPSLSSGRSTRAFRWNGMIGKDYWQLVYGPYRKILWRRRVVSSRNEGEDWERSSSYSHPHPPNICNLKMITLYTTLSPLTSLPPAWLPSKQWEWILECDKIFTVIVVRHAIMITH